MRATLQRQMQRDEDERMNRASYTCKEAAAATDLLRCIPVLTLARLGLELGGPRDWAMGERGGELVFARGLLPPCRDGMESF